MQRIKKNTLGLRLFIYGLKIPLLKKKIKKLRKRRRVAPGGGYGGGMGRTKPLTEQEQALLDEGWQELGESIAAAVLVGGRGVRWAWELLGPLGLYKRWMLDAWLERYREEHPELEGKVKRPVGRPRSKHKPKPKQRSKFKKKEQIQEALKMLNERTSR
jgi:hypothetical protein